MENNTSEVCIVGAGPGGLSAALTLASEGRSVVLLERRSKAGGQAGTSSLIENFPPHPDGFPGPDFADKTCAQCRRFGVQIEYNTEALAIIPACDSYVVHTNHGYFHSRAVLLAMGLVNRALGVPGEDHPDVYHGMNMLALDGDLCGKHVVLVGGGNSAGQAAMFYLGRGASVTLVVRRPIEQTMSDYLVKRIGEASIIQGEVTRFREGPCGLVVVVDYHKRMRADCVHVFVGQAPATDWLDGFIELDAKGFILTDNQHKTSRPGIYAVGDVVSDAVRRVACAVGYANEAVPAIHAYLSGEPVCNLEA